MFSYPQATESFLSGADKTGFWHSSDEDKKNQNSFLGWYVNFSLFSFVWEPKWAWIEVDQNSSQPFSLNNEFSRAQVIIRGQQSQVIPKSFLSATHCQTRGKWLQGGTLLFDVVIRCCSLSTLQSLVPEVGMEVMQWLPLSEVFCCLQSRTVQLLAPSYRVLL